MADPLGAQALDDLADLVREALLADVDRDAEPARPGRLDERLEVGVRVARAEARPAMSIPTTPRGA